MNSQLSEQSIMIMDFKKNIQNYKNCEKVTGIKIIRQYQYDNNHEYYQKIQDLLNVQSRLYYAIFFQDNYKQKNIQISLPQSIDNNQILIEQLKILSEQIKKDSEDKRFAKYHESIQWLKEFDVDNHMDFLLQINSLLKYKDTIKSGFYQDQDQNQQKIQEHAILLHQNFNRKRNNLLYISSIIYKLDEIELQRQNRKFDPNYNVYYVNLTFENSQQDIQFWSYITNSQKQLYKLITFQIIDDDNGGQQNLRPNTSQEIIIPIILPSDNIFKKKHFMIIYNSLISQHFQGDNQNIIYIELTNNQNIKIDNEAIEYIIHKFSKLGQVIIFFTHNDKCQINFNNQINLPNEEIKAEDEIFQIVNASILGLQGIKKQQTIIINSESENDKLVIWLKKMQQFYSSKNQLMIQNILQEQVLFQNHCQIKNKNLSIDQNQFYLVLNNQARWIQPKIKDQIQSFKNLNVFHNSNSVVLFNNGDVYFNIYKDITTDQQKYQKINLKSHIQLEPSIISINDLILFIYGFEDNNYQILQSKIQAYNIKNSKTIEFIRSEFELNMNYKFFKQESQNQILQRIKTRRGQQVCINNQQMTNKDVISFILFGGEDFKTNKIMNIIEFIFINLETQQFFSRIVDTQKLSKSSSLRPWPNQIILQAEQNEHKKCQLYLALCGNHSNKLNYYSFPINLSYKDYAQLFVLTDQNIQFFEISTNRKDSEIQDIESIIDNSRNWKVLEQSLDSCTWTILISKIIQFKNSDDQDFQQKFKRFNKIVQNRFYNVCFEITVKLYLPNNEDYKNCKIDLNCIIKKIYEN